MPARKGTKSSNAIGLRRLAGMTVLSLLAVGAVAAAGGCAGTREPEPSLTRVDKVPYRSLDLLKMNIVANSRRWQTLEATCDLTILNPSQSEHTYSEQRPGAQGRTDRVRQAQSKGQPGG